MKKAAVRHRTMMAVLAIVLIVVAFSGPPRVISQMMSNLLNIQIPRRRAKRTMVVFRLGRVTSQKQRSVPAPHPRAAS